MTLGELTTLCFAKIDEKNPLRLPNTPSVVSSSEEYEEVVNDIVEQYRANCDYSSLLMHAISDIYSTLYEELGLTREEVQNLPPETPLPPRTNELTEKLRNFPHEFNDEPIAEKIKRAFALLGVGNFHDLSNAYAQEDQVLMKAGTWDDQDPTLITNQVKGILEGINPAALDEVDRFWWREIMWFWYHHAISCAIWTRKDRTLAQRYADTARKIQGQLGHPNRITEMLRLLVYGQLEDAQELSDQLLTEAHSAEQLLKEYERGEFFK